MSNREKLSNQLSENIPVNSGECIKTQDKLAFVTKTVLKKLQEEYKNKLEIGKNNELCYNNEEYFFGSKVNISKERLKLLIEQKELLKYYYDDEKKFAIFNEHIDGNCLRPDGGIIYIKIKDKKFPIGITEAKRQNNFVMQGEYSGRRTIGNAIERAAKNIAVLREYFYNCYYFPYAIFLEGTICKEINFINSRLCSYNYDLPVNELYVFYPKKEIKPYSLFVKEIFTIEEIENIVYNLCKLSIKYLYKEGFIIENK
jgi:hypothetical protein